MGSILRGGRISREGYELYWFQDRGHDNWMEIGEGCYYAHLVTSCHLSALQSFILQVQLQPLLEGAGLKNCHLDKLPFHGVRLFVRGLGSGELWVRLGVR